MERKQIGKGGAEKEEETKHRLRKPADSSVFIGTFLHATHSSHSAAANSLRYRAMRVRTSAVRACDAINEPLA